MELTVIAVVQDFRGSNRHFQLSWSFSGQDTCTLHSLQCILANNRQEAVEWWSLLVELMYLTARTCKVVGESLLGE